VNAINRQIVTVGVLSLFGVGCASLTGRADVATEPSVTRAANATNARTESSAANGTPAAWWSRFSTSALDTLIGVALVQNTDVQLATARLAESRATTRATNANVDPAVSLAGDFTRSQQVLGNFGAISTSVASVSSSASWELDLFGRLRQERAAAVADGIAALYDAADVRRTTVAQIARAYVDVVSATQALAVLEAQLATRQDTRRLEASRARAGLSSSLDAIRADAAEREIVSQLPGVRVQRAEAMSDLATLTGRTTAWVEAVIREAVPFTSVPTDSGNALLNASVERMVSTGMRSDSTMQIPADQLRARPDVRASEARVVAAAARVKVARAALMPSLSLGGTLGRNKTNDNSWVTTWSFGPSLALTIPNRAGRAQVDVRRAQLLQREIEWRAAVRDAATDAELARARVIAYQERLMRQRETVAAYRNLAAIAQTRWTSGLTDFRDVVDARRAELESTRTLVEQWSAYTKAVVTWHQTIGSAVDSNE